MAGFIEFGACKALYGCVGMTAEEAYVSISKMKCMTALALESATTIPLCDIVVIDTVQTMITCKSFINSDMVVIVCDSGPRIATLKNVIPYDYEGDIFSKFNLKQPPKTVPLKDSLPTRIEVVRTDMVKEAMQSIITVSMLADFSAITSKMNGHARRILRQKIAALMFNKETVDNIATFIKSLDIEADDFIAKLSSKYFIALRNAVYYHYQGHTLDYVTEKFGVKDSYEVSFFTRMVKEHYNHE